MSRPATAATGTPRPLPPRRSRAPRSSTSRARGATRRAPRLEAALAPAARARSPPKVALVPAPDATRAPLPGAPPSLDFDHHPLLAIWEVTQACDLACQHCRACATPARDEAELNTAEGLRLLDAVHAMGTPVVVLTGGDPAKRPDLPALVAHGADGDVRALATVLGVQYSRVGPRDFTHSNVITVVDPRGLVARQVEGLDLQLVARSVDELAQLGAHHGEHDERALASRALEDRPRRLLGAHAGVEAKLGARVGELEERRPHDLLGRLACGIGEHIDGPDSFAHATDSFDAALSGARVPYP